MLDQVMAGGDAAVRVSLPRVVSFESHSIQNGGVTLQSLRLCHEELLSLSAGK